MYGTHPDFLSRDNSPSTSLAAAATVDTQKLEAMVHKCIHAAGKKGCISDDVLGCYPNYPYSSITARYSALKRKDLIDYLKDEYGQEVKRNGRSGRGQRVMISIVKPSDEH